MNSKIISISNLEDAIGGLFSSYCHLLKIELKEKWVIHRHDNNSDVLVVDSKFVKTIDTKNNITIIINDNQNEKSIKKNDDKGYYISLPLTSYKIKTVLNSISETHIQNKKISNIKVNKFRLKKMFSSLKCFYKKHQKPNVKTPIQNNKRSYNITDTLLKLSSPEKAKILKVVFLGRPGSGKTTSIISASSGKLMTSEVNATDSVGLIKEQTTIGIDFGECKFKDGTTLWLYGTPGQGRYNYLQTQTLERANINIILIDLTSIAPYGEFCHYHKLIKTHGSNNSINVAAFTHYDHAEHDTNALAREIKRKCQGEIIIVKMDPRKKNQVVNTLEKIALSCQVSQRC